MKISPFISTISNKNFHSSIFLIGHDLLQLVFYSFEARALRTPIGKGLYYYWTYFP